MKSGRSLRHLAVLAVVTIAATLITPTSAHITTLNTQAKIQVKIEVKDAAGNPIGGARVNVWHDTWGPNTGPPDYQEETDSLGVVVLRVLASKSTELSVEINKGDLWSKGQIKLSGPTVTHRAVLKKLNADQEAAQINVKVHVEEEKEGTAITAPGKRPAGPPLAGVRLIVRENLGSPRVLVEAFTDAAGDATLPLIAWNYKITAVKDGYETGGTRVYLTTKQRGLTVNAPTITLKKKAGSEVNVEVVVTVQNAANKNFVNGAQVVLTGKGGLTSGVYTGTTVDGVARIPVKEYGRFDVEISQDYFEPASGEMRILSGETQKELPAYLLTEKPKKAETGDVVKVRVLAGDKNNSPITGASVTVGNKTVQTDATGLATLDTTLGFDSTFVVVTASAEGYKRQSKSVQIKRGVRYSDAGASATMVMEPGEDVAADDTPIRLVVEIIDSFTNKPLGQTNVQIRYKGKVVAIEDTNEVGEARIEIKGSDSLPLEELRTGLKIDAYHDNYVRRDSDISSGQLSPSKVPRIVTLHLERDWTELRKSVATLEGRVTAWNNDLVLVSGKALSVKKLVSETSSAEMQAIKLSDGLGTGIMADDIPGGKPSAATMCRKAGELRQSIQQYETDALAKERSLKQLLDNAGGVAATCSSVQQSQAVKRDYNGAVRLSGEIGALVNKARTANEQLVTVANMLKGRAKISDVESKVAEIVKLSHAADKAAIDAEVDTRRADALSKGLPGRHTALTGELATLRTTYGINKSGTGLPADIKQRLDTIEDLLGRRNNDVMSGPNPTTPELVKASAEKIRNIKTEAERALSALKNTATQCEVAPMNDAFDRIGNTIVSATIELSAAASLNSRADDCAKRGACQPLLADVRGLMENDDLETAATRISAARAQSCDVTQLESDLDYFRTVRQTANLIASSLDSCRFQEALQLSQQIPVGMKGRPLVANALEAARRGVEAKRRIAELRESARNLVARLNNNAAANPYVAQAAQAADGFPCLAQEVSKFRDEYKVTALINKPPQVETIPDEADQPVETAIVKPTTRRVSPTTKPTTTLEELPEDAERPTATTTRRTGTTRPRPASTNRTATGTTRRPEVETIPDVKDTQTQSAGDLLRRRTSRDTSSNSTDNSNSTSKKPTVGGVSGVRWVLDSATVRPETPNPDWTYSAKSGTAQRLIYNGDKSTYQWTMPQEFDLSGFSIPLNVQVQPGKDSRMSSVISIGAGYGMTTDTPSDEMGAYAGNKPDDPTGTGASAQKTITFKPGPSASTIQFTVALHWGGVVFSYVYIRAK
jgi:hypothetical protein